MGESRRLSRTGSLKPIVSAGEPAGPGVKGSLILTAAIALIVAGALMFVFQVDWAGPREGWIVGGAVLGGGGIAALTWFFHKWGSL